MPETPETPRRSAAGVAVRMSAGEAAGIAAALAVLLAAALLSAGCADGRAPAPVQPEMVSLYADLALAAGVSGEAAPDSVRREIHRRHGIPSEALHEALRDYRRDPRSWVAFFSAVVDTLEARTSP